MKPDYNRVNLRELDASCTAAAAVQRSENVSSAKKYEVFNLRRESNRTVKAKRNSYAFYQQREANAKFHELAVVRNENLLKDIVESATESFDVDPSCHMNNSGAYLSGLGDKGSSDNQAIGTMESNAVSEIDTFKIGDYMWSHSAEMLPARDQVRIAIELNVVVPFEYLCVLAKNAADEAIVLRHVQDFAVLVRGIWVHKSSLVDISSVFPSLKRVMSEEKARALRDLLLACLDRSDSPAVQKKAITDVYKPGTQALKEMLPTICTRFKGQNKMWMLKRKRGEDKNFVRRYPKVAAAQRKLLESLYNDSIAL